MATVYMGNPFPIFNGRPTADPTAVTRIVIPDSRSLDEALRDVVHEDTHHYGLWVEHSAGNPSWVESDHAELAEAIANHYGCPVGRPADEGDSK